MSSDTLPVAGPVGHLRPPSGTTWSITDYEQLPEDGLRYELLDGALRMSPAPTPDHQASSMLLAFHLLRCLQLRGHGRVFAAPLDVELGPATVVQPDLIVILAQSAAVITPRRIVGPPDLIIEISSPSTASYDRREKRDLYAAAGVREYWIVDPGNRSIELLILDDGTYRAERIYLGQAIVPSTVVTEWDVATDTLFGTH
ncbi:MAG: Uma2 family endonuclease [Oscillochloridaceae bacterium umkhey_bin13]